MNSNFQSMESTTKSTNRITVLKANIEKCDKIDEEEEALKIALEAMASLRAYTKPSNTFSGIAASNNSLKS